MMCRCARGQVEQPTSPERDLRAGDQPAVAMVSLQGRRGRRLVAGVSGHLDLCPGHHQKALRLCCQSYYQVGLFLLVCLFFLKRCAFWYKSLVSLSVSLPGWPIFVLVSLLVCLSKMLHFLIQVSRETLLSVSHPGWPFFVGFVCLFVCLKCCAF